MELHELKRCPCCGGQPAYRKDYDCDIAPYKDNYIKCNECGLSSRHEMRHDDDGMSMGIVNAWNARIGDEATKDD